MANGNHGLRFSVQFDGNPGKLPAYQALVFDQNGKLLHQSPVQEKDFSIPFSEKDIFGKRIFLAALQQGRKTDLSLRQLEKGAGYEVIVPSQASTGSSIVLSPISEAIWKWWIFCSCHVRGRVFNLCGGQYLPVYKARVHICEVDPIVLYLTKLPDKDILKLRDDILARAVHWHLPDPPPEINPSFREAGIVPIAAKENMSAAGTASGPQDLLKALPAENLSYFYSDSADLIRRYLTDHYWVFYPYWCLIKSVFLRCDEVSVVETNLSGWFETDIWYLCAGDKPDLYFWVEYFINGSWTIVYKPWIGCYTHWNYICNSEVDVYMNNPAIPCPSVPTIPGKTIVVTTLGNRASVSRVDQATGNTQGLAPDLWYGYGDRGPFGGSVEPHVFFGDELIPSGIKYYRWSYRKNTDADIPANWKPMEKNVDRHYFHTNPDLSTSFPVYNLGPKSQKPDLSPLANTNLFEIQTTFHPVTGEPWYILDARTDTATAYFQTRGLASGDVAAAAGLYDIKLEFFDVNGVQVNLTDLGITVQIPDPTYAAPFGDTEVPNILAPAEYRLLDGGGKLLGFRMLLHVDNNPTQALIHETQVGINTAGPCGMITYHHKNTDFAHIAFEAYHPNDFAYFGFSIRKGSSGEVHGVNGNVSNIPAVNVYDRTTPVLPEPYTYNSTTDRFDTDKHVGTLLEDCQEGAFAEVLNVYNTATDGWGRLNGHDYDSGDVKAFALKHN